MDNTKKPRLLILGRKFPLSIHSEMENSLSTILGNSVDKITVDGSGARPFSADDLLDWAGSGKYVDSPHVKCLEQGCELYVGIETPKSELSNIKTTDGKHDIYQLGERGYTISTEKGIPSLMMSQYNEDEVFKFVLKNLK